MLSRTRSRTTFKNFSCRSDTLNNANDGGTVTFKSYNSNNTLWKTNNFIKIFWKALDQLLDSEIKNRVCHLKKSMWSLPTIILTTLPKIKLIRSINRSFRTLQLLSEALFCKTYIFLKNSSIPIFLVHPMYVFLFQCTCWEAIIRAYWNMRRK